MTLFKIVEVQFKNLQNFPCLKVMFKTSNFNLSRSIALN